jgi:hypothetical protein
MIRLKSSKNLRFFFFSLAILGWFGLAGQFYLNMIGQSQGITTGVIRYFSYFTILTNLLIAFVSTVLAFKPESSRGNFFSRSSTLTAIAIYILFVSIIYNAALSSLWNPQGLQFIVDLLLHNIIPVLFLLFWFIAAPKAGLRWKDVFGWLLYPLGYFLWTVLHGRVSGFYPYPFIDVSVLGYQKVLATGFLLILVFLFVSLLFVAIGKIMLRK